MFSTSIYQNVTIKGTVEPGERIRLHYGNKLSLGGRRKNHFQGSITILDGAGIFYRAKCVGTSHPRFVYEVCDPIACAYTPVEIVPPEPKKTFLQYVLHLLHPTSPRPRTPSPSPTY